MVVLRNGDRVTGEVKGLEQGRLTFKTDHMGTEDLRVVRPSDAASP